MLTKPVDEGAESPGTFIHAARREQLVHAAIDLFAEVGIELASTVRIAQRAGVSRGVVNYHFTDRDDLVDSVVAEIYRVGREVVGPPVADAPTPRDAVLRFVGASVDFYADYPAHMGALKEIFTAARRSPVRSRSARAAHQDEMTDLTTLLRAAQATGQMRTFDPAGMAIVIRAALDTVPAQLAAGVPPATLRDDLVRTIDAATRNA